MTALRRFTPMQADAIEAYREATLGSDFVALLTAVTGLAKACLYEEDAGEAIAEGYEIYGDNEGGRLI